MNPKIQYNLKDNGTFSFILNKLKSTLFLLAIISVSLSIYRLFILRWTNNFLISFAEKDEVGYLNNFLYFQQHGWYKTVAEGCSPLFNLFTYFLNFFFEDPLHSMKSLSLLCMLIILVVWWYFIKRYTKIDKDLKFVLLLFIGSLLTYRNFFFTAIDDPLFLVFITISFLILYSALKENRFKSINFLLSGFLFACAISTRPLFVFYLLGFGVIFFVLFIKSKKNFKVILFFILSCIITISIIHFPSLKENRKLSFFNKDFQNKNVTWAEINYLFLLKNKENLLHGRNNQLKPSAEEVIEYKNKFGEISLPKTYFESFKTLPFQLHLKNFIGLLYLQAMPFLRQIGIFFPFFILISFFIFLKNKFKVGVQLIPFVFYITFAFSICILPIVHLEFRWFSFFTILIAVFSFNFFGQSFNAYNNIKMILFYINIIIISILNIFYVGVW